MLCALLPRSGKPAPFRLPRSAFADVNSKPKPYSHIPCVYFFCPRAAYMIRSDPGRGTHSPFLLLSTYRIDSGLKYLCKMPLKEPGPECQCEGSACDERCLNRILHIECIGGGGGGAASEGEGGGGGGNNGKKEKYHNCNAGPGCGNRQFRNKEYIKHQVRLTDFAYAMHRLRCEFAIF